MKNILYVLLLLCTGFIYADAGPKFKDEIKLFFYENGKLLSLKDYKLLLLEKSGTEYDTINARTSTGDYWTLTTLQESDNNYYLNVKHPKPIIIKLLYNNKVYESDLIDIGTNKHILKFNIEQNKLKDVSPLFYVEWTSYFIMLAITLFIEIFLGVLAFRKWFGLSFGKMVLIVFVINIVTHPLLWYVYTHYNVSLLLLEVIVVCLEALVYAKFTSLRKALVFSLVVNFISFVIGAICNFFITDL